MSPYLFALFIDDIVKLFVRNNIGCNLGFVCVSIFLYADDIILLTPSVEALQQMINLCEQQLSSLDMCLNAKKSLCMRFGPRYDCECCDLTLATGEKLCWVKTCRYLGVYLVAARQFKCSVDNNKKSFYRSFNAILAR